MSTQFITPTAPAVIIPQTPAEKLSEAQLLISRALRTSDDEARDYLSWGDREMMSRNLTAALRLMREARETVTAPAPGVACCLTCGEEELAETIEANGCQTCAADLAFADLADQPAPMVAHVYSNGYHTRLRITVADLEEVIMRCGWTITEQIENLTDEARAEIQRLGAQEYVQSQFSQDNPDEARAWWTTRVIDRTPCLTPDM
jgi:hypothetical protein